MKTTNENLPRIHERKVEMEKVWIVARMSDNRSTPVDHKLFFIKESAEKYIERETPVFKAAKIAYPHFSHFVLKEFAEVK